MRRHGTQAEAREGLILADGQKRHEMQGFGFRMLPSIQIGSREQLYEVRLPPGKIGAQRRRRGRRASA